VWYDPGVKRPPRILLNGVTVASLVLCVATSAAWVVSYFAYDAVGFWPSPVERRVYGVVSNHGTIYVASLPEGSGGSRWRWRHDTGRVRGPLIAGTAGFAFRRERGFVVGVPYWVVCPALVVLPAWRWARRRRSAAPGLCSQCGYDLRATPHRCPECGHTPAHSQPDVGGQTVSSLTPGPATTPEHFDARP
jgi:hypothetical protein